MSPKETETYFTDRNVSAERQSYTVGDRSITFVSVVNQEKPTVFFFHGAPGSWSAFKEFLVDSALINRFSLVSVDRPGYGHSDFGWVEPSLKNQAFLMKPLLEKYANTPNILVGHSLGGPVIAKIAMEYPDLVDGLVMVAPSIDPDLEPEEDWFRIPMQSPFVNWAIPTSFLVTNEE
ncbi:MAG: alpha/beta hydrolase, partial [Bacteroidota bacterium]